MVTQLAAVVSLRFVHAKGGDACDSLRTHVLLTLLLY